MVWGSMETNVPCNFKHLFSEIKTQQQQYFNEKWPTVANCVQSIEYYDCKVSKQVVGSKYRV